VTQESDSSLNKTTPDDDISEHVPIAPSIRVLGQKQPKNSNSRTPMSTESPFVLSHNKTNKTVARAEVPSRELDNFDQAASRLENTPKRPF